MFPSVSQSPGDKLTQKIKEKHWDDRQGSKGGIPDYSPMKDRHTKSYRRLVSSSQPKDVPETHAKRKKTYFQRKVELVEELKQIHKTNVNAVVRFDEIMTKMNAPNFYIYYSLLPLLNETDIKGRLLLEERKTGKDNSSHFHAISTAIKARDECLERLRSTLKKLKEIEIIDRKAELKEEISHLRYLTANVIDEIKKWRDSLDPIEEKAIYYTEDQENYLVKLLNDNRFLFTSQLSSSLNFAQKNDPFVLVPLKKAEGMEQSPYTDIIAADKDLEYYQKYMEYLATEKAYDLKVNMSPAPKKGYTNPVVEKIYKPMHKNTSKPKQQHPVNDQDDFKDMQKQKQRQDRLKKNQERINSIKSIYETYSKQKAPSHHKEKKVMETDNQDKKESNRKKEEKHTKLQQSTFVTNEFETLVTARMDMQKTPIIKSRSHKSVSNPKSEQKMIESLKGIQYTLKSKLQLIQNQDKIEKKSKQIKMETQTKFEKKSQEEVINELKQEIMTKLDKQMQDKDKTRKKKREDDEKLLEEIKVKMKKEMQQKLEQKKREKMLEREELEKKLKEEEERLNSQRHLELQLQIKINKQKELRELEKVRREALQREKKFKEELEKERSARMDKEKLIERERKEKERLLEQLKKKELKQQLEEELKRQLKEKYKNDNSKLIDERDLHVLQHEKQQELSKEIELLKVKGNAEMEQIRKQNELRERMLKLKKDEEELKRKEVQQLMKSAIQDEKEQISREAVKHRVELEEGMRNNVKEKLLEEYRNEKQEQIEKQKFDRERQLEQQVYRDKVRQKIEKEMRIDAIQKTRKELDERENRIYEVKSKLDGVKTNFEKQVELDKGKIEEDVKKDLIEKVIFDKQAEREAAKSSLRAQFEKDLMASAIPQIYETKDPYLLKNIKTYDDHSYLEGKMHEQRPTNQKPYVEQTPLKRSSVQEIKSSLTNEELYVYSKQKTKVSEHREEPNNQLPKKLPEEEEGFHLLRVDQSIKEEEEYDVKIVRKPKEEKKEPQYPKKKKKREEESEDSEEELKKKKKSSRKKKPKYQEDSDEEDHRRKSKRKRKYDEEDSDESPRKKTKKRKRKGEDSESSGNEKANINKKIQYKTSEQEKMRQKGKKEAEKNKNIMVHYDVQTKKEPNFNQLQPVTIKASKMAHEKDKFKITVQAIPEDELDEYLQGHYRNLPDLQIKIQTQNREELYRKLINELTFCLLLGYYENKLIGMAYAYHDRTRSDLRKFIIVHIGTYKIEDLRDFVLSTSNYIFKKDPTDEVEFHYKFDEKAPEQLQFSNSFNKWFDRYGNVYQKRIEDEEYGRKYVLKRQFNQKCDVMLGGINKNTFRNLFLVNCGVLMSDSDMLQFKEQLRDVIAPENEVSYAIMIAELFRTYLSPDEADNLKNKVKEFVKLKELLVLVVMMQKKKIKMDELKLNEYKNLVQLNMRLMSQGKQVIRYVKDSHIDLNHLYYCELNHAFNLPFQFQTTSLPLQAKENQVRQISYFRLSPLPPNKLHIIKSSVYNAQINILPTENSKYKIFVMQAQQYNEIKEQNNLDIFMYIRLFLKNVKSHNVAIWKYVWLPEMTDKASWSVREFRSFLNKDIYAHDSLNISYRQFLPGALIIEPQHRDLVITPPFIVGVMSMTLEQVTEGSPLYARMIEVDALKTLEIEE